MTSFCLIQGQFCSGGKPGLWISDWLDREHLIFAKTVFI